MIKCSSFLFLVIAQCHLIKDIISQLIVSKLSGSTVIVTY